MASAELTSRRPWRLPSGLLGAWAAGHVAIWTATLGAAATVAAIAPLKSPVRHVLGLRLHAGHTPAPGAGRALALAAHNIPIATWPLLLGVLGAHRSPAGRRAADTVLVACLAMNVLPVGAALGAYGPALVPYLPQLPLEWAALALGASAWMLQRRRAMSLPQALALAALTAVLLICAAALETLVVPRRPDSGTIAFGRMNSQGGLRGACVDTLREHTHEELKDETSGHGCPNSTKR